MPRYFECPDTSTNDNPTELTFLNNGSIRCRDSIDTSYQFIELEAAPPLLVDLLSPVFTTEERFLIAGMITLALCMAWAFNAAGKAISK